MIVLLLPAVIAGGAFGFMLPAYALVMLMLATIFCCTAWKIASRTQHSLVWRDTSVYAVGFWISAWIVFVL